MSKHGLWYALWFMGMVCNECWSTYDGYYIMIRQIGLSWGILELKLKCMYCLVHSCAHYEGCQMNQNSNTPLTLYFVLTPPLFYVWYMHCSYIIVCTVFVNVCGFTFVRFPSYFFAVSLSLLYLYLFITSQRHLVK